MRWNIDPSHSNAGFVVKHLMITNVRGRFAKVSGTVEYDEKQPEKSSVDVTIDASSIDTREEQRDGHLKSPDFFDVAKYPALTFKSTKVKAKGNGELEVTGDLTIRGVTKPTTLKVEGPSAPGKDPWGNTRIGASATGSINRKDFGLTWNQALEAGGVLVGETVKLELEVSLVAA